jgi:hypothetical protein
MILDSNSTSTTVNFDLFRKIILEDPRLLHSIWPGTKLQASVPVLKGSSNEMAPDQMYRLPYHQHRRYDGSHAIYSCFEQQDSRKCTPSLVFCRWQERLSRLLCLALLARQAREDILPSEDLSSTHRMFDLERWSNVHRHKFACTAHCTGSSWSLLASSLGRDVEDTGLHEPVSNPCADVHAS